MEASLQVHLILTLLRLLQTLLGGILLIGLCISFHDTHVVNTVSPILPEVLEQKVSLLFRGLWWIFRCVGDASGTGWIVFRLLHGANLVDEGVVAHV